MKKTAGCRTVLIDVKQKYPQYFAIVNRAKDSDPKMTRVLCEPFVQFFPFPKRSRYSAGEITGI